MNRPITSNAEKTALTHSAEPLAVNDSKITDSFTEDEILAVLTSKSRWLTFPAQLETLYLDKHIPSAIRRFHMLTPLMLLLYVIFISGIIVVIPERDFVRWLAIDGWVTVAILGVMLISYFSRFNRWYQWYSACGSAVVIGVSITVSNMFPFGSSMPLPYAGIIFSVLAVYTCVGLTFPWVITAGVSGGILGAALAYLMGASLDWSLLHRTYTCANLLGAGLSYALENQERKNFLNTYLLRLTVLKGENLAKQLDALARHDSLTGLANRRHLGDLLNDELNRAVRQRQPLTVMMIDVDYFKLYNDNRGHLAGDECLRQISQLLSTMTQRSGELAARYGGEEFVLVYPVMDANLAEQQALRLLEALEALALPHPNGNFVTFSIGIAVCSPTEGTSIKQLLHHADAALYSAKENGRNRYAFYNKSMHELKHSEVTH
jgi:diguanylate cyclase (GGDEF)-like protein